MGDAGVFGWAGALEAYFWKLNGLSSTLRGREAEGDVGG
jgi:hypothetical protein